MNDHVIDAHIHLDLYTKTEQELILTDLGTYNIETLISVSNHLESAKENLALSHLSDMVKPAFGFHPEQALPPDRDISDLLTFIKSHQEKMVAVGEVGLPYYLKQKNMTLQIEPYIEILEIMIKQAAILNKPIVLHAVYEDARRVCDLLEKHSIKQAHFHWFKGDYNTIERMAESGYYISVTPDVLYEKEIRDLVATYPLSQLMVETDGPWPFEGRFKNTMTHPKMIHHIVKEIAYIKRMALKDVYQNIFMNTKQFYRLSL